MHYFRTEHGESHKYSSALQRVDDASANVHSNSESDHVFIWHLDKDECHDYHDATGASFEFYLQQPHASVVKLRVKKCAIRVLQSLDDAKKLVQGKPSIFDSIEH